MNQRPIGFHVCTSRTGKIGNVVQKCSVLTYAGGPPSERMTSQTPVRNAMPADVVTISPRMRDIARKLPQWRVRWWTL